MNRRRRAGAEGAGSRGNASQRPGAKRNAASAPRGRRRRATTVELVCTRTGRATVIGVRSTRTKRVLFACCGVGRGGAELAMLTAERYCGERGYVVVMTPREVERAA